MLSKNRPKGQSLAEYGLVLALVTVFCLASLQLLGNNLSSFVNNAASSITAAING